jgi:AraC-like DNA-binding protein
MVDDDYLSDYLQIERIGKGFIRAADKSWDGLTRTDAPNSCVFQYTISGVGTLRVGDAVSKIKPGQAFAVVVPSDHEYYLDDRDDKWEVLYIILRGEWSKQVFLKISSRIGTTFNVDEDSDLILLLYSIYERVKQREIKDLFEAASLAYAFVMEFYKLSLDVLTEGYPALVRQAMDIIKNDYRSIDSTESIARKLGVSKVHLIRVFKHFVGIPPGQYLIKTRLGHATILLLNSELSLAKIAEATGFSGGNYLGKVLRQHLGMPTGEYRRSQSITPLK